MPTTGDVVLISFEEQPAFFARIEDIASDRKRDWYQVRLLVLQVPLTEVLWILRDEYLNGEAFTMNGRSLRIETVTTPKGRVPGAASLPSDGDPGEKDASVRDKVISIFDRKRP